MRAAVPEDLHHLDLVGACRRLRRNDLLIGDTLLIIGGTGPACQRDQQHQEQDSVAETVTFHLALVIEIGMRIDAEAIGAAHRRAQMLMPELYFMLE